jgi:hypothetical protein
MAGMSEEAESAYVEQLIADNDLVIAVWQDKGEVGMLPMKGPARNGNLARERPTTIGAYGGRPRRKGKSPSVGDPP